MMKLVFSTLFFLVFIKGTDPIYGAEKLTYPAIASEQEFSPDKSIQDLYNLTKQRKSIQEQFNSKSDWTTIGRNRFLAASLARLLKEGEPKRQTIFQMKIEGNDLLITHTDPKGNKSTNYSRYAISNLKCEWRIKKYQTVCQSAFKIYHKNIENYLRFFTAINELQELNKFAKNTIYKMIDYFKKNDMRAKRDQKHEMLYREKLSEFLSIIEECDRDHYFESEYSHSMTCFLNISWEYKQNYDVFSFQLNQAKDLGDEQWLNESKALFRGFFISLLDHPSLIFQTDIYCLVSVVKQALLMFSHDREISSLIDHLLLDKQNYLLTYIDHLEKIANSSILSKRYEIDREQFLMRIKIENDLLFLLNQIREKRSLYTLNGDTEASTSSQETHDFPHYSFDSSYGDELTAKYHRSLMRSFMILNAFLETDTDGKAFISYITDEINTEENLKHDHDFNLYGRFGVVGHFLEQIKKNLDKDPNLPLSQESWDIIKFMMHEGQPMENIESFFVSLIRV